MKIDPSSPGGEFRLRGRGWETDGGDLWEVLERLDREGCSRFVVTDVTKDGTLNGPNLELLAKVTERTDAPVIASGGVSSLDDLRAIATLTDRGVEGAIVGKALVRRTIHAAAGAGRGGAVGRRWRWTRPTSTPWSPRPPRSWTTPPSRSSKVTAPTRRCRRRATTSPPRSTWPSNVRWSRRSTPKTGIEVHGEEFGGADVDSPLVWVLDPIDGTFNYAAGSPMAAILLGLLRDGEPVAGLTWLPFTGERYTAVVG